MAYKCFVKRVTEAWMTLCLKKNFMRTFLLFSLSILLFGACRNEYREELVPMVGVYDAYIVDLDGPFDLVVSLEDGDDIFLETYFDGVLWTTVLADVDNENDFIKYIDIHDQSLDPETEIRGQGVFNDGSIQLDYELCWSGACQWYTLIANKY